MQAFWERDPFVRDLLAFISRKTFPVRDLKPTGPVCVFCLASALTMGPVRSGPVCIYFPQDIPGMGPETVGSHLRVLACKRFGNGTHLFRTCSYFLFASLANFGSQTFFVCSKQIYRMTKTLKLVGIVFWEKSCPMQSSIAYPVYRK